MAQSQSGDVNSLLQQLILPLLLQVMQNHPELMQQAQQMHNQRMAGDVIPFPGPSLFEAATRRVGGTVTKNPYPPSTETMRAGLQDLIDAGRLTLTPGNAK